MNLPDTKTVLGAAKTGWGAYSAVKDAVGVVTSPVQWAKGKLLEALRAVLLAAFTATLGPRLAELAIERMNLVGKSLDMRFDVTLPEAVASRLTEPDSLELLRNLVNETLAAPLELLGWRAGSVAVAFDAPTRRLDVMLQLGVLPLEHEAALFPRAPQAPGEPLAAPALPPEGHASMPRPD